MPTHADQWLQEVDTALAVGAFRRAAECLLAAAGGDRRSRALAVNRLAAAVDAAARPLPSTADRDWLLQRLGALDPTVLHAEEHRALSAAVTALRPPAPWRPGQAQIPLVSTVALSGRPYGFVRTLHVRTDRWVGRPEFAHLGQARDRPGDALLDTFAAAAWLAQDHAVALCGPALAVPQLVRGRGASGSFPGLPGEVAIEGESFGLGAGIATLSSLLEQPVSPELAFTGILVDHGPVEPVADATLPIKLGAVRDAGLRALMLPAKQACLAHDIVRREGLGLDIIPVDTFAAAADAALGGGALQRGIQHLRGLVNRTPDAVLARVDHDQQLPRHPVLLSLVSAADDSRPPRQAQRGQPDAPVSFHQGPVMTLCQLLRPRSVWLLYTTAERAGPGNDFKGVAEAVRDAARLAAVTPEVHLLPLEDVSDPTDYRQLLLACAEAAKQAARQVQGPVGQDWGEVPVAVNLSSGPPQAAVVWFLLAERGRLSRDPHLLQVRRPKHLRPGEQAAQRVRLPPLR